MINGLIGKKVGMTQLLLDNGLAIAVTVIQAGPCVVLQKKTVQKDGYDAAQIGLVEFVKSKHVTKPMAKIFKNASVAPMKILREMKVTGDAEVKPGDRVMVDIFAAQERVHVVGTSKGRGFAGVVKRHKFRGGRASHGSMFHRAPGSIGASAYPSRVVKGMRMGGHLGMDRVTVQNMRIERVDAEKNLLYLRGAVPGPNGGYVLVEKA